MTFPPEGMELQAKAMPLHIAGTSRLHQDYLLPQGIYVMQYMSHILCTRLIDSRTILFNTQLKTITLVEVRIGMHATPIVTMYSEIGIAAIAWAGTNGSYSVCHRCT